MDFDKILNNIVFLNGKLITCNILHDIINNYSPFLVIRMGNHLLDNNIVITNKGNSIRIKILKNGNKKIKFFKNTKNFYKFLFLYLLSNKI